MAINFSHFSAIRNVNFDKSQFIQFFFPRFQENFQVLPIPGETSRISQTEWIPTT